MRELTVMTAPERSDNERIQYLFYSIGYQDVVTVIGNPDSFVACSRSRRMVGDTVRDVIMLTSSVAKVDGQREYETLMLADSHNEDDEFKRNHSDFLQVLNKIPHSYRTSTGSNAPFHKMLQWWIKQTSKPMARRLNFIRETDYVPEEMRDIVATWESGF